jgi:3-deoxy-alpha-D-manno-octulosonate 8-oxidase
MVPRLVFGRGAFNQLGDILAEKRTAERSAMVFVVDDVFRDRPLAGRLPSESRDQVLWVNVDDEPKTSYVDQLTQQAREYTAGDGVLPAGVIGIGGGSAMDLAKAVALMLTNPGSSAEYQGWDLIKNPAVYHAAVPTLSGTGAEVSRTAVLTGPEKKLGLNSDYTVFDQLVLDPELIADVPADQRFYTGMDCYIHCVESLAGGFCNPFSRACAEKAQALCLKVFLEGGAENEDDLMMASFLGGLSIAYSQVGVCHAISYGLSFVLGLHHGIGNCVVFDYLEEFYPDGVRDFRRMQAHHGIELPRGLTADLDETQIEKMIDVSLVMEPLWEHALGRDWKTVMTRDRVRELFLRM